MLQRQVPTDILGKFPPKLPGLRGMEELPEIGAMNCLEYAPPKIPRILSTVFAQCAVARILSTFFAQCAVARILSTV